MGQKFRLEDEIFPPFEGFPAQGINFLKRLKNNNNREWFNDHKSEYENFAKFPMQVLISSLKGPMGKMAPEIDVNPKRAMFRIYKDTRFSKDKKPYKTHVSAVFHVKGHWQESAGFYIEISPDGVYVGGGFYMPDKDQLKKIRGSIAERSADFLEVVEGKRFVRRFGTIQGERLQRTPLGYERDHPMIEWLRYKQFYAGVEWKAKECLDEKFLKKVMDVYGDLYPLVAFINKALGKI